jgi:hypothetical protein
MRHCRIINIMRLISRLFQAQIFGATVENSVPPDDQDTVLCTPLFIYLQHSFSVFVVMVTLYP